MTLFPLRPYSSYSIPVTRPIPGPDGIVPAGNPYGTITYWEYPRELVGPQYNVNTRTSPDGTPDNTFKTIEAAATKRYSNGWQFMASYSATKKDIPIAASNPNQEINTRDQSWEFTSRISGAYRFPYEITASANFENRSGNPQAPNFLFRGGATIPSISLNTAPLGSFRLPTTNVLDVRVQKAFAVYRAHRLTTRLNIYNVMNANTVQSWTTRLGPNYLRPSTILPPRIAELSVSYSF